MRVFSQINTLPAKKQTNKQNKRGAPLLGLAKSIYYSYPYKSHTPLGDWGERHRVKT